MSDEGSDLEAVSRLWDATASARATDHLRGWLDHPEVVALVQERQSGERALPWLSFLCRELKLPRDLSWLSLGCGAADTEIGAAEAGLFGRMHAFDISPASLELARRKCRERGIERIQLDTMDLNDVRLPTASFDVALMCMSLHHVSNLEGTLAALSRALRPGGVLLLNEYVGPRRFQFPREQVHAVEKLLATLPDFLRVDATTGRPKATYHVFPVEHWELADPSEAIRSDEILDQVERRFEVVIRRDYGGTLLALALEHIVHNFWQEDPKDVALLAALAAAEDLLLASGALASDYTLLAARPRSTAQTLARALSPRALARSGAGLGRRLRRRLR